MKPAKAKEILKKYGEQTQKEIQEMLKSAMKAALEGKVISLYTEQNKVDLFQEWVSLCSEKLNSDEGHQNEK